MRNAPTKIALFAGATLALAVLVVVAWPWITSSRDTNVTAATPNASAPIERARVEPETLAPLDGVPVTNVALPEEEMQRVEVSDNAFDKQQFATVTLKGRIESSRKDLELAEIDVRPVWVVTGINEMRPAGRLLTAQVQADGGFEFDVTNLIQDRKRGRIALELMVSVTHPTLASVTQAVAVPSEEQLLRERHIDLTINLQVAWGSATLRGEVRTVDNATVSFRASAFQTYDHRHLVSVNASNNHPGFVPSVVTGIAGVVADRAFRIEVHADVEYAVVVAADGYRPSTMRVTARDGESVTLPLIVLERGETLAGQLLLGATESVDGATVAIEPACEYTKALVQGLVTLAWCGDVFEWERRTARVGADRRYEFGQLGARAYKLSIGNVPSAYCEDIPPIEVVAPSTHADIASGSACEVRLAFFNAGQPAVVYFGLQQERSGQMQHVASQHSGADGRVTLFIKPGTATRIAFIDRVGERKITIPACTGGVVELRVDL